MYKLLSSIVLYTLVVLSLSACSGQPVSEQEQITEQHQTTQVEQYNSNSGGEQKQCNRSVVIQKNGKTETYQSSECR